MKTNKIKKNHIWKFKITLIIYFNKRKQSTAVVDKSMLEKKNFYCVLLIFGMKGRSKRCLSSCMIFLVVGKNEVKILVNLETAL